MSTVLDQANESAVRTPAADGFAMPARFDEHARTLVTWPPEEERVGTDVEGFRKEIEQLVHAISRFEPVTLIVDPKDEPDARDRCGEAAELLSVPVDACWLRDNGPILVRDSNGDVAGVHFGFNGWGGRTAYARTREMPRHAIDHLGMRCYETPFICEGGGISVDGSGTLITNEQVMRNPNRYAGLSREEVEQRLHDYLGIEHVIWLALGLVEDTETDGHDHEQRADRPRRPTPSGHSAGTRGCACTGRTGWSIPRSRTRAPPHTRSARAPPATTDATSGASSSGSRPTSCSRESCARPARRASRCPTPTPT